MMQAAEHIKNVIFYVPRLFKAIAFILRNMPEFIGGGGKSFHTPLSSTAGTVKGKSYYFRTVIQSDGDIINILPRVSVDLHERYQEKYREHYGKVKQFCSELEGLSTIAKAISMLSGFAVMFTMNSGLHIEMGREMKIYFCAILWTISSFLFHKFVSKHIFRLLIDIIVKYAKAKAF